MNVRCSADTNVGLKREINQDSYGIGDTSPENNKGFLLVVCDGMGGHSAGEVASKVGVETILNTYYNSDSPERQDILEQSFLDANENIYQEGEGTMGTTGVASLIYKGLLFIANVGDSRAYLIREGHIDQISRDHSLVAEQVAAGLMTAEQARHSNYRNMITRALGYRPEVQVDIFNLPLQAGDIILLTSDGLHGLVDDDEINQVASHHEPEQAVQKLIAMANDRGGIDNITVAIAIIDDIGETLFVHDENQDEQEDNGDSHNRITTPMFRIEPSDSAATKRLSVETVRLPEESAKNTSSSSSSPSLPTPERNTQSAQPRSSPKWRFVGIMGGAIAFLVVVVLGIVTLRNPAQISLSPPDTATSITRPTSLQKSVVSPTQLITPTIPLSSTETITPTKQLSVTQTQSLSSTLHGFTRTHPSSR